MATKTTATPADVNVRDHNGCTNIFLAAEAGDAAEVARLLELKADFELPMTDLSKYLSHLNDKKTILLIYFYLIRHRYTPLHVACEKGHAPVARLLLKAGAKIEAKDYARFACVDLIEFMTSIDKGFYSGCVM